MPKAEGKATIETVLKTLADARLVITDKDEVEVAHEALIRSWPTLRRWLEENREWLRWQRRLTESAQEWDKAGRHADLLYRRTALEQTEDKAQGHENELMPLERG